ncbi:restriction endonuclease [Candidatus Parcubacteria bacterium]|nr:restriction endonuclease [Candidatus Parcubacteria bacterium]
MITVAKADGTHEPYDSDKLIHSLKRSGASQDQADEVAIHIERELRSGMTTNEIYAKAFEHLRTHRRGVAARYSLKRAVLDLGPSGFPFESFIEQLFIAEGYTTKIDQIIKGKCVEHEVDVVMTKDGVITYVEAKFHNTAGFKTDLKTTLYVKARQDDIGDGQALIVTNTKFTDHALRYAECQRLELLGWDYPQGNNLHERIEKHQIYPITALTTLGHHEKMALLSQRLVLCKALPNETRALAEAGLTGKKADAVLEEVGALCPA